MTDSNPRRYLPYNQIKLPNQEDHIGQEVRAELSQNPCHRPISIPERVPEHHVGPRRRVSCFCMKRCLARPGEGGTPPSLSLSLSHSASTVSWPLCWVPAWPGRLHSDFDNIFLSGERTRMMKVFLGMGLLIRPSGSTTLYDLRRFETEMLPKWFERFTIDWNSAEIKFKFRYSAS